MRKRALFIDRDGTLVHARHYPSRPEQLVLYEGVGQGLRLLQAADFLLIVITNQGGIAHGYFDEADLALMHAHLQSELADQGVRVDAFYHCPHHPEGVIPALAVPCECRKPQPGMLLRAAAEYTIDLGASWFVGDILDDVEAGRRAGCRTALVDIGTESLPTSSVRMPDAVARDTRHALALIAAVEQLGPPVELDYLPTSWHVTREVTA